MRRRHFIQIASAAMAGTVLTGPLGAALSIAEKADGNRLETVSRNILCCLRNAGLLTLLEGQEVRVLGGSVYALAQGIIPDKIQLGVAEERFEEACTALSHSSNRVIELWSDRFSCCHIGDGLPVAVHFSSLSYLARFENVSPLGGLFRHQQLSFDVRRQAIADPSGWLTLDQPRVEISEAIHHRLGETVRRELLLLAGLERTVFGIDFGAELEAWQSELPPQSPLTFDMPPIDA